jgi:hypothetical protein
MARGIESVLCGRLARIVIILEHIGIRVARRRPAFRARPDRRPGSRAAKLPSPPFVAPARRQKSRLPKLILAELKFEADLRLSQTEQDQIVASPTTS